MTGPTPPGDIPLFEGLGTEWNDVISLFPEDKRGEWAPKIQEKIKAYEPLKQYEDLHRSGINPEHIGVALSTLSAIENNPRQVYETIGNYLGITAQEAKEVVEEVKDGNINEDPRLVAMERQLNTLAQIALAQRQSEQSATLAAQQDKQLEDEMNNLKKKYGDFPEDEIIMRMLHLEMSAEEAYKAYTSRVEEIQKRRPAPFVMGSGGSVPRTPPDVKKMTGSETKNFVAQMLQHANQERNT